MLKQIGKFFIALIMMAVIIGGALVLSSLWQPGQPQDIKVAIKHPNAAPAQSIMPQSKEEEELEEITPVASEQPKFKAKAEKKAVVTEVKKETASKKMEPVIIEMPLLTQPDEKPAETVASIPTLAIIEPGQKIKSEMETTSDQNELKPEMSSLMSDLLGSPQKDIKSIEIIGENINTETHSEIVAEKEIASSPKTEKVIIPEDSEKRDPKVNSTLVAGPAMLEKQAVGSSDQDKFFLAWNGKTSEGTQPNSSEWIDLSGNIRWYKGLNGGANPDVTSRYFDAGVYPLGYYSNDARNYFGGGLRYNGWDGETANGSKFEGNRWLVNLRSKQFLDDMDWGAMLHFGKQENSSKNSAGTWQGKQSADLAGFGGNISWYPRKNAGETWFSEIDGWGSVLFPLNKESIASFKGRPQKYGFDTNLIASVGGRVYIWDAYRETPLPIRFFGEAEFLGELPSASSFGASLGITDKWDIFFAQVGLKVDVSKGLNYSFVGVGVDASKVVDLGIKKYRQSEAGEFQKTALVFNGDSASIE